MTLESRIRMPSPQALRRPDTSAGPAVLSVFPRLLRLAQRFSLQRGGLYGGDCGRWRGSAAWVGCLVMHQRMRGKVSDRPCCTLLEKRLMA